MKEKANPMFTSELVEHAAKMSKTWHEGQVDKAGQPYWTHPARVAQNLQSWPGFAELSHKDKERALCTAYLHDVLEDCDVSRVVLLDNGFDMGIMHPVYLLTKDDSFTTIENYCENLRGNKIARAVKLADLSDNCNLQRQALLREQGYVIDEEKYPRVKALLKPSEAEEEWFQETIST
jgi:GTP diphosphokinase / guanosine-3',5'-bis(diphosphate) 3'-diphosphatase